MKFRNQHFLCVISTCCCFIFLLFHLGKQLFYINKEIIKQEPRLWIIMSDTRLPTPTFETASYPSLAATINYIYAQKHGYGFCYYHLDLPVRSTISNQEPHEGSCLHSKLGPRNSAWCKLLSIHDMFMNPNISEGSRVFFIDSDAIFLNHSVSIDQYFLTAPYRVSPVKGASLIVGDNWPFKMAGCSGIIMMIKNDFSRAMLQRWWNFNDDLDYFNMHDFEQHALNQGLLRYNQGYFRTQISVVNFFMFREFPGQFIRHIGRYEIDMELNVSGIPVRLRILRKALIAMLAAHAPEDVAIIGIASLFAGIIDDLLKKHFRSMRAETVHDLEISIEAPHHSHLTENIEAAYAGTPLSERAFTDLENQLPLFYKESYYAAIARSDTIKRELKEIARSGREKKKVQRQSRHK